MGGKKKIKVGLDFDGVVAYNPLRVARKPVACFKRWVLGKKKKEFMIPKNSLTRWLWTLAHETSVFPGVQPEYLKRLAAARNIELHLVTARFSFLDRNLNKWLAKYDLTHVFKSISINTQDEQPHEYKLRLIKSLELDYFIEDNWDIVEHLDRKTKTKIVWITNFLDCKKPFPLKYRRLLDALSWIAESNKMRIPENA